MTPEAKLQAMGIQLPPVAIPAASYLPFVQTGNLLFVSGHIPKRNGVVITGQLGRDVSTNQAQNIARQVAIDLLSTVQAAVGDLSRVQRIVKLLGLVNSTPDYTEQHLVINGCSELLAQVFGPERGSHARSAFGVAQLPMGAVLEIELTLELAQ